MKRYKAELMCRITAFTDLIVEADTPEQARDIAIAEAKQLSKHDWDLEEVEDIELNTYGLPVEIDLEQVGEVAMQLRE